jgi:hypothetical protein
MGWRWNQTLVLKLNQFENPSFLDWVVFGFSFAQLGSGKFLSFVLSLKTRGKNRHKSWEGFVKEQRIVTRVGKVCERTKNRHKSCWEGL